MAHTILQVLLMALRSHFPTEAIHSLQLSHGPYLRIWTSMLSNSTFAKLPEYYLKAAFFCITLNVQNSITLDRIKTGKSTVDLSRQYGKYSYTMNLDRPEECFAHSKDAINTSLEANGFEILEMMEGWWSTGIPREEYHDCIVCQKRTSF